MTRLWPDAIVPLSIEQLRSGPLGRDLERFVAIARGVSYDLPERVTKAIDSVLQILFWPPGTEDYTVPRTFWETDLAHLLMMAKFRVFDLKDLVSIGQVAKELGVTRPTIYRWLDDRTLDYVRDEMNSRTFVTRKSLDRLKREMDLAALRR